MPSTATVSETDATPATRAADATLATNGDLTEPGAGWSNRAHPPTNSDSAPAGGRVTLSAKWGGKRVQRLMNNPTWSKKNPAPSHADYLTMIQDELEELGSKETCPKKMNGTAPKCSCNQILRSAGVRSVVAPYVYDFLKRPKRDQNQTVLEWYRYASEGGSIRGGGKTGTDRLQRYFLPYNSLPRDDGIDLLTDEDKELLPKATVCPHIMGSILGIRVTV